MRKLFYFLMCTQVLIGCTEEGSKEEVSAHIKEPSQSECAEVFNGKRSLSEKIEDIVLTEDQIGVEHFMKRQVEKWIEEYRITYLGALKGKDDDSLKFVRSIIYTGLYEDSKRASGSIAIYRGNFKLGHYNIGGDYYKDIKVAGTNVIFSYSDSKGKCSESTTVSFSDSIPREIFITCSGTMGNVYKFIPLAR